MPSQVVWFDIPATDLDRALKFYNAVLNTQMKKESHGGTAVAVLPHEGESIGGCIYVDNDAKPGKDGPLLYLNCQGRLDDAIANVEKHGGKILIPKAPLGPYGFRAVVLDSEGNLIALHSM